MPMTYTELLATSNPAMLGEMDKQRRFVLGQLVRPMACPSCGTPQPYIQAAGLTVETVDLDKTTDDPCKCIACGRGLIYTVLMIGGPCWSLDPIAPTVSTPGASA